MLGFHSFVRKLCIEFFFLIVFKMWYMHSKKKIYSAPLPVK